MEYNLDGNRGDKGITAAVLTFCPVLDSVTLLGIILLKLSFSLKVDVLKDGACIGSLNVITMIGCKGTFVALLTGEVLITLGGVLSICGGSVPCIFTI